MKTVILCGGKGTRIRDVSAAVPKPMVEVAGLPIVHHIMNYYARYGLSDFVLCLGYKGEVIYDYFSRLATASTDKTISISQNDTITKATSKTQWNIALVDTGLETMTGGRIRRISSHVSNETFTLTYGDGLSNIDIQKLIEHHRTCGKTLTISGVRPPSRFGELTVSGNLVVGFDEKPQAASGLISGGYFVCEPRLFDYLDDADSLVFEREPIKALVRDEQVAVYTHEDFWQCMDTYRDWEYLNDIAQKGVAPWLG